MTITFIHFLTTVAAISLANLMGHGDAYSLNQSGIEVKTTPWTEIVARALSILAV